MNDAVQNSEALGVGSVLSGAFGMFFSRIHVLVPLAFVPYLLFSIVSTIAFPSSGNNAFDVSDSGIAGYVVIQFLGLLLGIVVTTAVTLGAVDLRAGNALRIGFYFQRAIVGLPSILILSILLFLMIALGYFVLFLVLMPLGISVFDDSYGGPIGFAIFLFAMIAPTVLALYLGARFGLFSTVIVAERANFGALSRASQLTKGYRWPVLGSYILMTGCLLLFLLAVSLIVGGAIAVLGDWLFANLLDMSTGVLLVVNALGSLLNAVMMAFASSYIAVLYTRLRYLKEGVNSEDLAAVFT